MTNGTDSTPVPEIIVKNPSNKELITFLANSIIETRQHTLELRGLYDMLRDFTMPVPKSWAHKLADSQEAHIERATQSLAALKSAIG